jgi:hypothetical protein
MVCLMAAQANGAGAAPMDLDSYKWKHRLILVFTPSPDAHPYQALVREVATQRGEILDRDIVLFWVFPDEVRSDNRVFDGSTSAALRKRFSIPPGAFEVILVGKDGGEKLRQRERADLREVFSRIDAMPMRQMEMKRKSKDP